MTKLAYSSAIVSDAIPRRWSWDALPFFGRAKPSHLLLAGFLYLFFAVFLIWPIGQIVKVGFVSKAGSFSLEYVKLISSDPLMVRGLLNAGIIAVCVTGLTLALSLPMAVL